MQPIPHHALVDVAGGRGRSPYPSLRQADDAANRAAKIIAITGGAAATAITGLFIASKVYGFQ